MTEAEQKFEVGDRVRKVRGSQWHGVVRGTYTASLTERGYVVESTREPGNVQVYPEAALELDPDVFESTPTLLSTLVHDIIERIIVDVIRPGTPEIRECSDVAEELRRYTPQLYTPRNRPQPKREATESEADYERRCSFDQPALDLARQLEAVFTSEPKRLRVTKAQIAITELLMAKTNPAALAQSAASGGKDIG